MGGVQGRDRVAPRDGRRDLSEVLVEGLYENRARGRLTINHSIDAAGQAPAIRCAPAFPTICGDPPHLMTFVGVQEDLRICNGDCPVPVDDDDGCALHMRAPLPYE